MTAIAGDDSGRRDGADYGRGDYDRDGGGERGDWRECGRSSGVGGALIGGTVGGVAGNVIAGRGSRVAGTIAGAGVGAVAGAVIDRSISRHDCREYGREDGIRVDGRGLRGRDRHGRGYSRDGYRSGYSYDGGYESGYEGGFSYGGGVTTVTHGAPTIIEETETTYETVSVGHARARLAPRRVYHAPACRCAAPVHHRARPHRRPAAPVVVGS